MITFMTGFTSVTTLVTRECLDVIHVKSQPGRRLVWVAGNWLSKIAKILKKLISNHLKKATFQAYFQRDSCNLRHKRQQKASDEILVARPGNAATLMLRSIPSIDTDRLRTSIR